MNKHQLQSPVVVIGAGGGMGSALATRLCENGTEVWGLDLKSAAQPPEARYHFIRTDLTDAASVQNAAEAIAREAGQIGALVYMAGLYDLNSLVEIPEADFERIFQVNLFGMYRAVKAFRPMLEPGGRLLLTSSELAPLDPLPFTGLYGITKTAVERYAFSLRMELQLLGHEVIVLRPGAVETGLLSVSTKRLNDFVDGTELYACNAARFRKIVNGVEARSVPPERIARLAEKALRARRPKYVYSINRNPGLLLLNALPARWQTAIIRTILQK